MSDDDVSSAAPTIPIRPMRKPYIPTGRPPGRPRGSVKKLKAELEPVVIKPAALRPIDAARYISVSESTIRKLVREGRVEAVKIGTVRLITVRSLDRLLVSGT
jgi:excisionase family DNA binding protein